MFTLARCITLQAFFFFSCALPSSRVPLFRSNPMSACLSLLPCGNVTNVIIQSCRHACWLYAVHLLRVKVYFEGVVLNVVINVDKLAPKRGDKSQECIFMMILLYLWLSLVFPGETLDTAVSLTYSAQRLASSVSCSGTTEPLLGKEVSVVLVVTTTLGKV